LELWEIAFTDLWIGERINQSRITTWLVVNSADVEALSTSEKCCIELVLSFVSLIIRIVPFPTTVTGGVFALLTVSAPCAAAARKAIAEAIIDCFMVTNYAREENEKEEARITTIKK
jgi:hypothetical protein